MEETKYYQPEIIEFHVGFEYEIRRRHTSASREIITTWVPCIQGEPDFGYYFISGEDPYKKDTREALYVLQDLISEKGVRVRCLDQEDIEGFGFIESHFSNINNAFYKYKNYTLLQDSTKVFISLNDSGNNVMLFNGKIKNKSDLKRLLKQLEII